MSAKILTVDDSRAVRIIIKKAFKAYDVDVVEATNGVEGLSAAASEKPDIILLDVTMPVMDGVEMLSKLKGDATLKNLPVIMLTAEAGRENILKIAKLGIRDYIVKPFKDELLVEKVGRVIDLRVKEDSSSIGKKKGLEDPFDILVVEDKPAIIAQIQKGLHHDNWTIHGVGNSTEALDFFNKTTPDIVLASLSIPDDAALNIFRFMRSNNKLKYCPVFGISVKTANEEQEKARGAGITSIIHKPIDFSDLEDKIIKALKLDTSSRYFRMTEELLVTTFPAVKKESSLREIDGYFRPKVNEAVDNGLAKVVFDLSALQGMDMEIIGLLIECMKVCTETGLRFSIVANDIVIAECSGFDESTEWNFYNSVEEAQKAMG